MRKTIGISLMFFLYGFWLYMIIYNNSDIGSVYIEGLRSNLFSGFLALGGFLLTLKIFIIVKLKEGVYDSDCYLENFATKAVEMNISLSNDVRTGNDKETDAFYYPLRQLSRFLVSCVILSMLASISNVTVGLINSVYTQSFCVGLAVSAIAIFVKIWWIVRGNLEDYFDYQEIACRKKVIGRISSIKELEDK